ncbi:hypothetical protein PRIPAC_93278 [Pristionchus pacificus]|uniref:CUB domain-containing protein n=1 Tax=Pristionchus pacificus TaxID=54126 RepID=A0A454XKU8_PRIPA|nr:hypothetical protein PRIPAC_93278 [Pristionchus pacificus]|eukprot:PDM68185.1 CUB domain-containing protein [Pristionchus pacificus]
MLVLLLALIGTCAALCPDGYLQISRTDCYTIYFTNQTTFVAAEADCVLDGGHLASLHSYDEQHSLAGMTYGMNPLIGMKCDDEAIANCTWTDGSVVDYQNFPGGVPVLSYGGCVRLGSNDEMWYSWNCAAPTDSFLCKVPAYDDIVTIPVEMTTAEPVPTTPIDHIKGCPKQQYTADTYVFSPNWPSPYQAGVDCLYFITAKNSRKLTIQFEYVETNDMIIVYDGSDMQSRVIANVTGKNGAAVWQYYSTGSTLTLDFIANSTTGGKGWSAAVYNV